MDIVEGTTEKDKRRYLWPALVIALGLLGYMTLIYLKKSPPRAPVSSHFTPVKTAIISPVQQRSVLQGYGTIQASKQVDLRPQVSGIITALNDGFFPGNELPEQHILAQIDPRDYDVQVSIQKAEVARAQAALLKEQGMQIVAEKEWNMVKGKLKTRPLQQDLALRKPQLKETQAVLEAAESNLAKATLDLERTTIQTPFQSLVIERQVSVGDYVTPQSTVARLAATDEYWVYVSVPHEQLRYLPTEENVPAEVIIRSGDTEARHYTAYVKSTLGNLSEEGRMARILVAIPEPRVQHPTYPLLLGAYADVRIEGISYNDVYPIPNEALRAKDRLWLYSDSDTLHLLDTEPLFVRDEKTYISVPDQNTLEVVISDISHPLEGLPLVRLDDMATKTTASIGTEK